MTLQNWFYVIGIIFMVLYILLLAALVILLFLIRNKVNYFYNKFEGKVKAVKDVVEHPDQIASNIGAAVAGSAVRKVRRVTSKKPARARRSRRGT